MRLTTRSEYALLALLYLARLAGDDPASVESIATAQDIPARYLEQIMQALKTAGYVRSSKGRSGGYRLAKSADQIVLADVIRLFDGALAPTESVSVYFYETTPIEREERLLNVFRDIRDYVAIRLETTTLADVR